MKNNAQTTKQRLLNAAEELFAIDGFSAVTVRQISRKAEADISLVYYHFKSKRDLFEAVLMRRAKYINELRLNELEKIEQRHTDDTPSVEEIIYAFVYPLLQKLHEDHKEWKHYFSLIAMVNNSPSWGGEMMTKYFDPLVHRFLKTIKRALPECDEADLFWSYHFLSGALTLTFAETGRIDNLSDGVCKSSDMKSIIERLPKFIAAGFTSLCTDKNSS
ncbi:MAG: TetR family transcriptional regulator [Alcanivoracaceae bacterium]|nr:TetR family transcriptional regulator [Alcanivoracaceae bacterium]